jgi:hypothetical protein
VAKDGSIKYVAIYSSASVEDGRFDHSRCFTIDISHQKQIEALAQERATLAAFTAAAGLFLTAGGGLRKWLEDVAAEAVAHLDLTAVEVWGRSQHDDGLVLLARAGVAIAPAEESVGIPIGRGPIGRIARTQQPRHLLDSHADWQEFDTACLARHGIRSFVGYPLLVADQLVGGPPLLPIHGADHLWRAGRQDPRSLYQGPRKAVRSSLRCRGHEGRDWTDEAAMAFSDGLA